MRLCVLLTDRHRCAPPCTASSPPFVSMAARSLSICFGRRALSWRADDCASGLALSLGLPQQASERPIIGRAADRWARADQRLVCFTCTAAGSLAGRGGGSGGAGGQWKAQRTDEPRTRKWDAQGPRALGRAVPARDSNRSAISSVRDPTASVTGWWKHEIRIVEMTCSHSDGHCWFPRSHFG